MPVSWRPGDFDTLADDALPCGREADGAPLYAARVRYQGGLYPGKVRDGFSGANFTCAGRELSLVPFEVLAGQGRWVRAQGGQVPDGALVAGHEPDGTPLYLARARVRGGVHPGHLTAGHQTASIPWGGSAIFAPRYQVLVATLAQPDPPAPTAEPLLSWDFENTMSAGPISISAGVPADPQAISGFVSQTGGGPAETWPQVGTVFLTRHLGSSEFFLWFTATRPVVLEAVTFRHWHNHNPGFPTCPSYQVQLQLDSGDGYQSVGPPLALSNANSGTTATVPLDLHLAPGSYKLRWHPRGLARGRDTSSEFFALKGLRLEGRVAEA